jgi:phosphate-selective porin OprO/OprP
MSGLEGVYSKGPLKIQGEYVQNAVDAATSLGEGSGTVKVYYTEMLYNLTGESWASTYRNGAFGGIKPNSNYSSGGGTGAWQIGVRYSKFDASDLSVTGTNSRTQNSDKASTLTVGLNWLMNTNARIMLNYSMTKFNNEVVPLDVTTSLVEYRDVERVLSVRTQVNF